MINTGRIQKILSTVFTLTVSMSTVVSDPSLATEGSDFVATDPGFVSTGVVRFLYMGLVALPSSGCLRYLASRSLLHLLMNTQLTWTNTSSFSFTQHKVWSSFKIQSWGGAVTPVPLMFLDGQDGQSKTYFLLSNFYYNINVRIGCPWQHEILAH